MPTVITGTDGINQVQAGAVESGDLPAGSVIQVVQGATTTEVLTTSTLVDTALSASIVPLSASNKILVLVDQYIRVFDSDPIAGASLGLLRNNSLIYGEDQLFEFNYNAGDSGSTDFRKRISLVYLDSPNSTSLVDYKTRISANDGATVSSSPNNIESTITLMEIAG